MPPSAPRPDRRPPSPVAGLLLLLGATIAVGGALGSALLDDGNTAGGAVGPLARTPPPAVVTPAVPLPVPGAEPGDVPEAPAPDALPPPAPATVPATPEPAVPGLPAPELPAPGTPAAQPPAPAPPPRDPVTTAPQVPAPEPAPTTTAATTPVTPQPPPLRPYVPPPTAVIPAGVLPDAAGAREVLRARLRAAAPGSRERGDLGWLLELDRRHLTADAPAGRRATIARALRVNAWWFADRDAPARRVILRDPDGMILTYREGHGFMMNPVATTGRWRGLNDELTPEALADRLLTMGVRRDDPRPSMAWEYYDVATEPDAMRPGVSGMAQGRMAELMATAYRRTGEARFAEAAGLALAGLALPVDEGGATSRVRLPGWDAARPWYVERAFPGDDPWKGAALNGFMVTLLSLRNTGARLARGPEAAETAGTTGSVAADPGPPPDPAALRAAELARTLADRGTVTLRDALPAHDLGDWSLYGLLTPGRPRGTYRADLNYHCYHVFLLRALARPYPDMGFGELADRWQGYVDMRGLTCPER